MDTNIKIIDIITITTVFLIILLSIISGNNMYIIGSSIIIFIWFGFKKIDRWFELKNLKM